MKCGKWLGVQNAVFGHCIGQYKENMLYHKTQKKFKQLSLPN